MIEGIAIKVAKDGFRYEVLRVGQRKWLLLLLLTKSSSCLLVLALSIEGLSHIDSKLACMNGYYFVVAKTWVGCISIPTEVILL